MTNMERWPQTNYKTTDKRHGVEKHVGKAELRSSYGLRGNAKATRCRRGVEEKEQERASLLSGELWEAGLPPLLSAAEDAKLDRQGTL